MINGENIGNLGNQGLSGVREGGNAEPFDKIEQYRRYCRETYQGTVEMPTLEIFDKKVEIATEVFPQRDDNGRIRYLFGKGVGAELAIRGEVGDRKKYNNRFPYRTHSDFEIYDYDGNYPTDAAIRDFYTIFGAEEIYPKNRTKALESIPEGYMDDTYETVRYNGREYLVPELEILFLDKYLLQESTPREEGCDAVLLAKEYDLDIDKVLRHYDDFVAKPKYEVIDARYTDEQIQKKKEVTIRRLREVLSYVENDLEECGREKTVESLSNSLNERIQMLSGSMYFNYLSTDIRVEQARDGSFVIGQEYIDKIDEMIRREKDSEKGGITKKRAEIEELLRGIAASKSSATDS
ncbi:hypothetical protein IKG29_03055 [Candidatus Saccharibacteria bacterium]|nr:hypothetical protein [Candidatus Saccharibacteria bacterium]